MRTDKINIIIKNILGENSKKILTKVLFPFRNRFILFNISNKAKNDRVNIDYWDESDNLGDLLSPIIVNYALSLKGIELEKKVHGRKHLYAVGSVLTAGIQDTTVWGSGILNSKILYRLKKRQLDIRAVRGPITRAVLNDYGFDCPAIYGDPAILLPNIYQVGTVDKKNNIGVIIHKDYSISNETLKDDYININICTNDYKSFIDQVVGCKKIISSSLHGIIIAEAYGIPAVLLKPQKDFLKYYDYYFSTGRTNFPIADTLKDAIEITPPELPDLSMMRIKLLEVFPYDLYY